MNNHDGFLALLTKSTLLHLVWSHPYCEIWPKTAFLHRIWSHIIILLWTNYVALLMHWAIWEEDCGLTVWFLLPLGNLVTKVPVPFVSLAGVLAVDEGYLLGASERLTVYFEQGDDEIDE